MTMGMNKGKAIRANGGVAWRFGGAGRYIYLSTLLSTSFSNNQDSSHL